MRVHAEIKRGPRIVPGAPWLDDLPGVSNHAQLRAMERLPAPLTRGEWLQLVLDILDRRAALLSVNTDTGTFRETWLCLVAGQPMRVVWMPAVALVITIMRPRKRALTHQIKHSDARKHGLMRPAPRRVLARERDWEHAE